MKVYSSLQVKIFKINSSALLRILLILPFSNFSLHFLKIVDNKGLQSTIADHRLSSLIVLSIKNEGAVYRVSQEECARLREGVPYAKIYRYNPKHLTPKWNGDGDNGLRKVWSSCGSTHCTCRLTLSPPSSLNVVSHDKLSAGRWAVNFTA